MFFRIPFYKNFILLIISMTLFYNCSSSLNTEKDYLMPEPKRIGSKKLDSLALSYLVNRADRLLNKKYKSVMDKNLIPPSGNKHDYLSRAVYLWPDTTKPNGLPWIYKDGQFNYKSLKETDHSSFYEVMGAIRDLSLAYFYTKDENYAKKTSDLIDFWFINDSTKMNPNMNFAQGVPGWKTGTQSGIIDSRAVLWVIEALAMIKNSDAYNIEQENNFKVWCGNYLDWLINSEFGKLESKSTNNHGTFYDIQVAKFADYLNKEKIVLTTFERVKKQRIERQILPDGSMPLELERADGFKYSTFTLSAFLELAILAKKYNINLWEYKTSKCGSIRDAYSFVFKKAIVENNWQYTGKVNIEYFYGIKKLAEEHFLRTLNKNGIIPNEIKFIPKYSDFYFIY